MTENEIHHSLSFHNQVIDVTKPGDAYESFVRTNRQLVSCSCGLDTGWVDKDTLDYDRLREEHPYSPRLKGLNGLDRVCMCPENGDEFYDSVLKARLVYRNGLWEEKR